LIADGAGLDVAADGGQVVVVAAAVAAGRRIVVVAADYAAHRLALALIDLALERV